MRLQRDLSGADLIKLLCKHFGYRRVDQEGSHVILETGELRQHRISIPDHAPLRVGTLNGILRAVAAVTGVDKAVILDLLSGFWKSCFCVFCVAAARKSPPALAEL